MIFLTSAEQAQRLLSQMARTPARHLLLVFPEDMDRLRGHLLLCLLRQQVGELALSLRVVTTNRQTRLLAEQMGFATAATLDDARGLAPGHVPTAHPRASQPFTPLAFPPLPPLGKSTPAPQPASPAQPTAAAPGPRLDHLLREGHLSNPAAIPSLEEEAQQAAREEEGQRDRFSYEFTDEHTPTLAQQESEEHEAQIIATIRKTSQISPPPEAPAPQPPEEQAERAEQEDDPAP